SVQKYDGSTISRPTFVAKSSAPWPTIITCFDFSMTARAAEIGFLMIVTPATEPAFIVFPSMIAESSSLRPSCVKTAPLPALKSGESSRMRIDASTASRLVPPRARMACPAFSASSSLARIWASASAVMFLRVIVPAPPQIADVLVENPRADANGLTIALLDTPRIVLWTEPPEPESSIGEFRDWIDLLQVHETTHLIHLLRPSRNPTRRLIETLLPVS